MSSAAHLRRKTAARKTRASMLGRRLKNARNALGLSQEQVAEHLDLSRSAITQWETGETGPDLPMIERVAAFLNITPEFLCFGADPGTQHASVNVPVIDFSRRRSAKNIVGQIGVEQDFFTHLGIANIETLKAFVLKTDPGIAGISRGDRIVIDESDKRITTKTMIGLMVQGEPRVAMATAVPSARKKPHARVTMGESEMDLPMSELKILGVVRSVIHGLATA